MENEAAMAISIIAFIVAVAFLILNISLWHDERKAMKGNDKIKVVKETIDWEMRRFEIAKAVLSNPAFIRTDEYEGISAFHVDYSVKTAIKVADTLIKKLKGGEG